MTFKKSKEDEFVDAILGPDEEMDEDVASFILAQHGIDELSLVDEFKNSLLEEDRKLVEDSLESVNLRTTIRNITEYQKTSSPDFMKPTDLIEGMFNHVPAAFPLPVYAAFQNRKEGEMPPEDKEILDEIERNLNRDLEQ